MKMQKKKQENSDSKYQKNTEMTEKRYPNTAKAQHFFLFQENHSESMFSNGGTVELLRFCNCYVTVELWNSGTVTFLYKRQPT